MPKTPEFDVKSAHKYFSAHCFNSAWGLIDKKDRTAEEDQQMIDLVQASIWHWTQREDCTDQNMSTGYWQASRIYALIGQADNARRFRSECASAFACIRTISSSSSMSDLPVFPP